MVINQELDKNWHLLIQCCVALLTIVQIVIYTGFTRMIEHITNVHNIKDIYVTGLLLCAIDPLHMQILLRYK